MCVCVCLCVCVCVSVCVCACASVCLCMTRMTQNKNDSINPILQYGRVVDKNCCVVFLASRFPYFILCPRQCKEKIATTYLVIRTKNN